MKKKILITLLFLMFCGVAISQEVSERVTWKALDTLEFDTDSLEVDTVKAQYQYVMLFVHSDTSISSPDTVVVEVLSPVYKVWTHIGVRDMLEVTNVKYIVPGASGHKLYMAYIPAPWIYRLRLTNLDEARRNVKVEMYGINR